MKTRTLAQKKFYFLLLLPLIASLLFLLSCIEESQKDLQSLANEELTEQSNTATSIENGKKIASIRWEGNTVYDDEKLNEILGLKPGDIWNEEVEINRLYYNEEQDDIASLYMDNGYLFFGIDIKEKKKENGDVDLTFTLFEGQQLKVDEIVIQGNSKISTDELLKLIIKSVKTEELFSRSKLIASQKAIADLGLFNPDEIMIQPIPNPEEGIVSLKYTFNEKALEN